MRCRAAIAVHTTVYYAGCFINRHMLQSSPGSRTRAHVLTAGSVGSEDAGITYLR
jgi:hypothetical protein